jgi:N,N'-diacetyllegionaminate synthase
MEKTVTIKGKRIGNGYSAYIIAEMACAHDGSLAKAKQLIDSAVDAKADAIQLQFFRADETVVPAHDVYEVLKRIEFTEEEWKGLIDYAKQSEIAVIVCTFDLPSVHMAVRLGADAIKLNSADLSNPQVVSAVAKSGLPFTLGTGASTDEEIEAGLRLAQSFGEDSIILMHGVQNFPTMTADLHIRRIKTLQNKFNVPVGYHDHTDGDDPFAQIVDLIAVGMGAHVIEKHITLNRSEKGIDYQASLEPAEFKRFVQNIRRAELALGESEKGAFTESDLRYRKFQKKSIVAARNIREGEVISQDDVRFIRNVVPGLPPSEIQKIVGKRAVQAINEYDNILIELVQ